MWEDYLYFFSSIQILILQIIVVDFYRLYYVGIQSYMMIKH